MTAVKKLELFEEGRALGRAAFANGVPCIPARDKAFHRYILASDGTNMDVRLRGWHRGWAEANVAAPVPA
jgi:hypothetical protein